MQHEELKNDPAAAIESLIKDHAATSSGNTLNNSANEKAWREPLVGFSSGDDPLYPEYRRHIGDFFWQPDEAFGHAFPDETVSPSELTVISWILPQALYTIEENAQEKVYASERWARARAFGEDYNMGLRAFVVDELARAGVEAMAPMCHPDWERKNSETYSFASVWSERHAAYAAGLGTFGFSDGLITAKGKAVRVGSVIARIQVPPSERPYDDPHAYCLYFTHGTCGKCMDRCPVSALTPEGGHNKDKCHLHVEKVCPEYIEKTYGLKNTYGCGLCQCGVPCSDHIPTPEEG